MLTAAFLALATGGAGACAFGAQEEPVSSDTDGSGGWDRVGGPAVDEEYPEDDEEYSQDDAGSGADDEVFYCADEEGVIVDEELCDGTHGPGHLLWHSPDYPPALVVGAVLYGGSSIPARDRRARATLGLPATGIVGNGTVKSNVVGQGGRTGAGGASAGG